MEAEDEEEQGKDLFQGKVESETERSGEEGGGMNCRDPPGVSWPSEFPHSGVEEEEDKEERWKDEEGQQLAATPGRL